MRSFANIKLSRKFPNFSVFQTIWKTLVTSKEGYSRKIVLFQILEYQSVDESINSETIIICFCFLK